MPAGIEIIGANGNTQITSDGVYFTVRATGNFSGVTWSDPSPIITNIPTFTQVANYKTGDLVVTGTLANAPMLAVHCPTGAFTYYLLSASGNTLTYRVHARTDSIAAGNMQWVLFDRSPPPAATFGFEVYSNSGTRVFSATTPVARPLGMVTTGGFVGGSLVAKKLGIAVGVSPSEHYYEFYNWDDSDPMYWEYEEIYTQEIGGFRAGIGVATVGYDNNHVLRKSRTALAELPPYQAEVVWGYGGGQAQALVLDLTNII